MRGKGLAAPLAEALAVPQTQLLQAGRAARQVHDEVVTYAVAAARERDLLERVF